MKLNKALKLKKKLITKANEARNRMSQSNSYDKDNKPTYDSKAEFEKWVDLTNKVIDLKAKIHIANAPIYPSIFRLSELKSLVSNFRGMSVNTQSVKRLNQETIQYVAVISQAEKDAQIELWENEIETIQDTIDIFNATTSIE